MLPVPSNISQTSTHTNFEYFQLMESNQRKENISQLSEKSKRFILAKNIKKYECEQKIKQSADFTNATQQNGTDKQSLLNDNKFDKANNVQTPKLTGFSHKNKDYVQSPKFLSPSDFVKKQGSPQNVLELRKNLSNNSLQPARVEKFEQALQSITEKVESLQESKSNTLQTRKYVGPNFLSNEDQLKEKNIFLQKNNPINHNLYKEFNIGPRVDKEGSPQWYNKQREIQEKQLNKERRTSQQQRYSIRGEDDDRYKPKNKSIYTNDNTQTLKKQLSFATEKSFMMRPDTGQSTMKQQLQQTKKKTQRRNESLVEEIINLTFKLTVSKDDLIREMRDIERRHEQSIQKEQDIINHLRFDERNIFTRDERVLKNHQKHLSDWDCQIKYSTEQSSRQPTDSCMLRGESHRRKVEYTQAFDNLKTEDERFGKRIWYMYLRKYPKDKSNQNEENKTNHRRIKTDLDTSQQKVDKELIPEQTTQRVPKNIPQKEEIANNGIKQKQKVKLKDLIDPNENTQSDIFSGFMTVSINDQNREIEVIRNIQDSNNFHLSSSSAFSNMKKSSSQFFIENKVRECQSKLKGKMVVLESPINDFLVVGHNKFEQEKKSILLNQNRFFNKVIQIEQLEDEKTTKSKKYSGTSWNSVQNSKQACSLANNTEVITQDYDMNELSRTGQHFFPNIIEKLNNPGPYIK